MAHREILTDDIRLERIQRILVIRPGGMGDMLLLLPVLQILRDRLPHATIDLVCEKRNIEVLDIANSVSGSLVYDRNPASFIYRLVKGGYDMVIDTEQFHHFSAIFSWISRAPVRIGFKINPVRNPLYTHLVNYEPDGPEPMQFAALLSALGIRECPAPRAGILGEHLPNLDESVSGKIDSAFCRKPFVAIHPGATIDCKQWPNERFAELSGLLHEEFDFGTLLVGGKSDTDAADSILSSLEPEMSTLSLTGHLSLPQVAATLRRSVLFVGGDSGLAHLAVAVGVPTVVIFGPSDPGKWGLETSSNAVVSVDLPCQPCCIFGYSKPCHSVPCMMQISVEQVLQGVRKILG
jgi:ADP-heptose:LPS heptosyltransferase